MLNRLGNALPRSGIDLSLRIADIDACLNECFQDFRLYTILRSFTRFLAGELRLPRLSRYVWLAWIVQACSPLLAGVVRHVLYPCMPFFALIVRCLEKNYLQTDHGRVRS